MTTNAKYELLPTDDCPLGPDVKLFRLKALRDIGRDVKAGALGGLVGGPYSLSQEGDCWIYRDAIVRSGAVISGNAKVRGTSRLLGDIRMNDDTEVHIGVQLMGDFELTGFDEIVDFIQIVNLKIRSTGHYLRGGNTTFAFICELGERGPDIHLAISAVSCHPRMATELAALSAGDRLAFIMKNDVPFPLEAPQYGKVQLADIKKALDNMAHVTNPKLIDLKNVTFLG